MLDENCENALKTILKSCSGGYTVLESNDFVNVCDIEKTLSRLSAGGYVSLGYSCDGEYLLMPTEKGENYFCGKTDRLIYKSVLRRECAVYSFFGAVAGGAVVAALFAIVMLFAR